MKFGMRLRFTDVLCDGTLKNVYYSGRKTGFSFDIRLGYYRGHYLSDIDEISVKVDGEEFSQDDITFSLNGREYGMAELGELYSVFWNLTTPATISIHRMGGLSAGEHRVELEMWMRVPYLPLPGGDNDHTYMPLDNCDSKTMTLIEA
jgi:hypothetical protein